jgi:hypothetical protein
MKKIDKRNRPQQQSKKLELQRETIRRLDAPELESARGGFGYTTRTLDNDI